MMMKDLTLFFIHQISMNARFRCKAGTSYALLNGFNGP